MSKVLNLVLKSKWFDLIKSGLKRAEYRVFKPYWIKRICKDKNITLSQAIEHIETDCDIVVFTNGYKKNAEKMKYSIDRIYVKPYGINTDMNCDEPVFVIKLGKRIG